MKLFTYPPSFWAGSMTSDEAETTLQRTPPGTFLVRKSANQGNLAVSFVDDTGNVRKTLIATTPKFSIPQSPEKGQFATLQELVKHCSSIFTTPYRSVVRGRTISRGHERVLFFDD